ncbi:MAG TPA: hypothetical protein VFR24_27340 [Candidatus Angelobacter sp.]|nr:hypothetical protein [Candidatus Angelobacter sp.]
MGSSAPSPPPVQPATQTEQQQFGYNINTGEAQQALNLIGQNTPFGSLNYEQTGTGPNGVPLYTANTTLDPTTQALLTSLRSGATNQVNQGGYTNNNASDVVGSATTGNTAALVQQGVDYLQPFYTTQTEQLDAQLRNQGIDPSSPAYANQMRQLQANQNQNVNSLITQFEPTAYNQAVSSYELPLQTAQQEFGMINPNYVPSSFASTPQTALQPTNAIQAQSNYQDALNQQYAQQVQANSNMMSGLFGIPSAVLGGMARSGSLGLPSFLGGSGAAVDAGMASAGADPAALLSLAAL